MSSMRERAIKAFNTPQVPLPQVDRPTYEDKAVAILSGLAKSYSRVTPRTYSLWEKICVRLGFYTLGATFFVRNSHVPTTTVIELEEKVWNGKKYSDTTNSLNRVRTVTITARKSNGNYVTFAAIEVKSLTQRIKHKYNQWLIRRKAIATIKGQK